MDFITKNKVLFTAIISALILGLQGALASGETDLKVIGFSVLIVILGILGNSWKGQGITITGVIGTVAYAAYTLYQSGNFSWHEAILSSVIALLATLMAKLQPEPEPPSEASLTNKPA